MVLQQSFDLMNIEMGAAIAIIGLFAILFAVIYLLQVWVSGIVWGFSLLLLLISSLIGLGMEFVWVGLIATVSIMLMELIVGVTNL